MDEEVHLQENSDKKLTGSAKSEGTEKLETPVKKFQSNLTNYYSSKEYEDRLDEKIQERRKLLLFFSVFSFAFIVLFTASLNNPQIYLIKQENLDVINQAFNALILLIIPFLLGSLGGVTRILMSGFKIMHNVNLIVSSGLMAMFSWVGIKSGVLLSIVAPHLKPKGVEVPLMTHVHNDFYTMALVAIIVGMFSTNLYIFVNQRVEQLTQKRINNETPNKTV